MKSDDFTLIVEPSRPSGIRKNPQKAFSFVGCLAVAIALLIVVAITTSSVSFVIQLLIPSYGSFPRTFVHSDAIRSIAYDAETHVLEIEFVSGELYEYFDVPQEVASRLLHSNSIGELFNRSIKRSGYRFRHTGRYHDKGFAPIPGVDATNPVSFGAVDPQLTGIWHTSKKETYRMSSTKNGLNIKLITGRGKRAGNGTLQFDGNRWVGSFEVVFDDDPLRAPRRSILQLIKSDGHSVIVSADEISWNKNGIETTRRPISFTMSKE